MKFKTIVSGAVLFAGIGIVAYGWLNGYRVRFNVEDVPIEESKPEQQHEFERWQLKEGSIYDGDTLRVVRGQEELKIRFCGIDAPEVKQKLGIESRDHLRSLVGLGNGELLIVPIEKDRYKRTVAEVYIQDSNNTAIHLNMQMLRDGYAWHYTKYSNSCINSEDFAIAQEAAQEEDLGVWNGSHQPPWEFRKANN